MLIEIGNWGYQVGAVGIVAFTIAFLVITRWWTDSLGRLVAGVLLMISLVLSMTVLRMFDIPLPGGLPIWRVIVFWGFGVSVWVGLITFLWAQFLAPRIRRSGGRMTTRREHNRDEQEAGMADYRHGSDGGSHDHSGLPH